jgi:hypothetical protein
MIGLSSLVAPAANAASGPIFTVMNTSESLPDGVYFRNSPHTADTSRITGLGVYKNERVQLQCYAFGDAVGPYSDRLWYYVNNVTRPTVSGRADVGYLNAHYINDGKSANVVDAGVPECGVTSSTGTSWAGYIATGSAITHVHSSWVVPTVDCLGAATSSEEVIWAGIDGFANNQLVQAGSGSYCATHLAAGSYYVWYEQLPSTAKIIENVAHGSTISVDISFNASTRNYTISMTINGGTPKNYTGHDAGAQLASAECIVEAPVDHGKRQPLADFHAVQFSSCAAGRNGSSTSYQIGAGTQAGLTVYRQDQVVNGSQKSSTNWPGLGGAPWVVTWKSS